MRSLTTRERRSLLVLIVVAVAMLVVVENDLATHETPTERTELPELGEPPSVDMARLETRAAGLDLPGRDLFSYFVPRVRQPRVIPPPPDEPPEPDPEPRIVRVPTPTPPAGPPPPAFRYIGLVGPKDDRTAVFAAGDEVIVAAIGEAIDGLFELAEFGHESVVVRRRGGTHRGETVTLRMGVAG